MCNTWANSVPPNMNPIGVSSPNKTTSEYVFPLSW
jgi:hypothetical protein